MKWAAAWSVLLGLLLQLGATTQKPGVPELEQKLLGAWKGPACGGNYTFKADHTFTLDSFTPGGNTLTGRWSIRWDAPPPTLILHCETSDFTRKDPTRDEYAYLGKALEVRLVELNDEHLAYRVPTEKRDRRFEKSAKN